jgi:hypothetical protein
MMLADFPGRKREYLKEEINGTATHRTNKKIGDLHRRMNTFRTGHQARTLFVKHVNSYLLGDSHNI